MSLREDKRGLRAPLVRSGGAAFASRNPRIVLARRLRRAANMTDLDHRAARMATLLDCELGTLIRPDRLQAILGVVVRDLGDSAAHDLAAELRRRVCAHVLDELGQLIASSQASLVADTAVVPFGAPGARVFYCADDIPRREPRSEIDAPRGAGSDTAVYEIDAHNVEAPPTVAYAL